MQKFCKILKEEKITLFGTAGFGGSEQYYQSLADRFSSSLADDNEILGSFYCQDKMPTSIRERYVEMIRKNPEDKNLEVIIEDFDANQSHPDRDDLINAKTFARDILQKL